MEIKWNEKKKNGAGETFPCGFGDFVVISQPRCVNPRVCRNVSLHLHTKASRSVRPTSGDYAVAAERLLFRSWKTVVGWKQWRKKKIKTVLLVKLTASPLLQSLFWLSAGCLLRQVIRGVSVGRPTVVILTIFSCSESTPVLFLFSVPVLLIIIL